MQKWGVCVCARALECVGVYSDPSHDSAQPMLGALCPLPYLYVCTQEMKCKVLREK